MLEKKATREASSRVSEELFIRTIVAQTLDFWAETRRLRVVFTFCHAAVMRIPRAAQVCDVFFSVHLLPAICTVRSVSFHSQLPRFSELPSTFILFLVLMKTYKRAGWRSSTVLHSYSIDAQFSSRMERSIPLTKNLRGFPQSLHINIYGQYLD